MVNGAPVVIEADKVSITDGGYGLHLMLLQVIPLKDLA